MCLYALLADMGLVARYSPGVNFLRWNLCWDLTRDDCTLVIRRRQP